MPPEAPLRITLDCAALAANWSALDALSGSASAGAALKADAYGLGARRIAPVLLDAGCRDFFVAHWAEAAELIGLIAPQQIAVLHGPQSPADAGFARDAGLRPVINSLHQARIWQEADGGLCDLMIDTGINRLGLPMADMGDPIIAGLQIEVLMSHLASADENSPQNELQRQRWQQARVHLPHRRASLANSAGIALGAAYHGDLTRPGLALYGGVPRDDLGAKIRQVAYPEAQIIQVRELQAGDSVGYNATFTASGPMRIGVVNLGYADGYLRCWSGKGAMQGEGQTLPVLGRVSMDMTVIDLTAAPALGEGEWVELAYALPEASRISGLSQYELLTALGRRFPR
ncbi:MAG: alanine racemase [Novosphingobium sp.]|uniref:alanine racemase n=1 Tax=Novosphingobium sp. TaxID=1874826 RepID=UPI0032BB8ADE